MTKNFGKYELRKYGNFNFFFFLQDSTPKVEL